ncbi:hypothetical protein GCM10009530_63030 [Microbispora corallina]|uniref:ATP-binding protein n=1 Tax=Microbispora corallina TaxID=83302 RepID=A0ABQ4GCJ2_9ACTN|nr:hypothetical protein [Microbispora corallina]GIH44803.1 hypothetical protein Mco01_78030 [Microbispora corallina]
MYEQSLPGVPEAADTVRPWARTAARQHHPRLADECELVVARLVANAIPRTPEDGLIAVTITPLARGLRVEVRDPGDPVTGGEGAEWAEVSTHAASWGGSRTAEGHMAWAELREPSMTVGELR